MDQTDDAQALVLSLADLIAQGKVQVRLYTRGRLHVKTYVFDFDPARIRAQTGAAIVGSYQRLYLVDEEGHRTADPQQVIRAIRCEENEPPLALPDGTNERIAAVKRDFDAKVRTREAEMHHTVDHALGRDYALAELRLVFDAEEDPGEKARLALLSEIFTTVPLTARAHRELNTLRRGRVTDQALVEQLLRIVRDYNLEEAHRAATDQDEEAVLIPCIVCSEALL